MRDFTFAATLMNALVHSKLSTPCTPINIGNTKISIMAVKDISICIVDLTEFKISFIFSILVLDLKFKINFEAAIHYCRNR